jgi:hypothetical protein
MKATTEHKTAINPNKIDQCIAFCDNEMDNPTKYL